MSIICGFFIHWACAITYRIGDFADEIEWQKFLSLACTALEKVCVWCIDLKKKPTKKQIWLVGVHLVEK